jgi:nickel/cobalt transporter (NiCoT) family protein
MPAAAAAAGPATRAALGRAATRAARAGAATRAVRAGAATAPPGPAPEWQGWATTHWTLLQVFCIFHTVTSSPPVKETALMAAVAARARRVAAALTPSEWGRAGGMAGTVLVLHLLGWGLLLAALSGHYHITKTEIFGVGTGILAYTLGMRHAFDADHIAAIDNTTRKLVAEGKRPLSVGFFFSLGHSSVVFVLAVLLNFGIRALNSQVRNSGSVLHSVTGTVGTLVSGTFLYLIAGLNVIILVSIGKVFRDMRRGHYDDSELEEQLAKRGLLNRFLGPLARRVDTPWKMYPIGLLFGLGFDTATEIALLVLAGSAVVSGLPFYAVLSLPLLFAAGMSLFDTADGCFMNFAYDWAFARPLRKVYYNLTVTGLSVIVAFFVGTIEVLGLIAQQSHLTGSWWGLMRDFNLNTAGFVIVGMFVLTWVVALAIWHFGRIEERWEAAASSAD